MESADLIGHVLHDTHRVVKVLGQGGMGVVYEAEHVRLKQKRFAVKVLLPALAAHKAHLARFRREAEIATAIGHPNIVSVVDFYDLADGRPCIVMEYLEGVDLCQWQTRCGGRLLPRDLALIVEDTAAGLQAAHDRGVVHRDLKPANLYLTTDVSGHTRVKILDFGISKMRDVGGTLTAEDTLMGTPAFMSPEQADGQAKDVDQRSDIFSFGSICFEMLYGQRAFDAPTTSGIVYKVCFAEIDPGPDATPPFSGAVRQALGKATAKNREDRYERVTDFARDFCEALHAIEGAPAASLRTINPAQQTVIGDRGESAGGRDSAPVPAHPTRNLCGAPSVGGNDSRPGESKPRQRRKAVLWGGVAMAALAVIAVLALYTRNDGHQRTILHPNLETTHGVASSNVASPVEVAEGVTKVNPVVANAVDDNGVHSGANPEKPRPKPTATAAASTSRRTKALPESQHRRANVRVRVVGISATATVHVDGEIQPQHTFNLKRSPKRHRVTVSEPGYEDFTTTIAALRNQRLVAKRVRQRSLTNKQENRNEPVATGHEQNGVKSGQNSPKPGQGWVVDPVIE